MYLNIKKIKIQGKRRKTLNFFQSKDQHPDEQPEQKGGKYEVRRNKESVSG